MLDGEPPAAVPAGVDRTGRDRAEPAGSRRQQGPRGRGAGHVPGDDLPQDTRIRDRRRKQLTTSPQVTAVLVQSENTCVSSWAYGCIKPAFAGGSLAQGAKSMTTVDTTAGGSPSTEAAPAAVIGPLAGDPSIFGLGSFIAGSVALGLGLVGVVPTGVLGAPLAIILAATALGLLVSAVWCAALGQSAVAAVF